MHKKLSILAFGAAFMWDSHNLWAQLLDEEVARAHHIFYERSSHDPRLEQFENILEWMGDKKVENEGIVKDFLLEKPVDMRALFFALRSIVRPESPRHGRSAGSAADIPAPRAQLERERERGSAGFPEWPPALFAYPKKAPSSPLAAQAPYKPPEVWGYADSGETKRFLDAETLRRAKFTLIHRMNQEFGEGKRTEEETELYATILYYLENTRLDPKSIDIEVFFNDTKLKYKLKQFCIRLQGLYDEQESAAARDPLGAQLPTGSGASSASYAPSPAAPSSLSVHEVGQTPSVSNLVHLTPEEVNKIMRIVKKNMCFVQEGPEKREIIMRDISNILSTKAVDPNFRWIRMFSVKDSRRLQFQPETVLEELQKEYGGSLS